MKKIFTLFCLVAVLLITTACTMAFEGDYVLKSGETLQGDLFVTSGNTTLQKNSRITGTLFTTSGNLTLEQNAVVEGSIISTSGTINLLPGSEVGGSLYHTGGAINQKPGAIVKGKLNRNATDSLSSGLLNLIGSYCLVPILILVAIIYGLTNAFRRPTPKTARPAPTSPAPVVPAQVAETPPVIVKTIETENPPEITKPPETLIPMDIPKPSEIVEPTGAVIPTEPLQPSVPEILPIPAVNLPTQTPENIIPAQPPAISPSEEIRQKLVQLKQLFDEGLITEAEYQEKKSEILKRI